MVVTDMASCTLNMFEAWVSIIHKSSQKFFNYGVYDFHGISVVVEEMGHSIELVFQVSSVVHGPHFTSLCHPWCNICGNYISKRHRMISPEAASKFLQEEFEIYNEMTKIQKFDLK